MTVSTTAWAALLLMDAIALPVLAGLALSSPLVALSGALLVMLLHPLLLWRL